MRQTIIDYLPWALSAITVWMTIHAGNKSRNHARWNRTKAKEAGE